MKTAAIIGIVVLIVCVSFLTGVFLFGQNFANEQNTPAPNSETSPIGTSIGTTIIPEHLVITNVEYAGGHSGWIAATVNNTGVSNVDIAKLMLDNVKQSTNLSPSLPITLEPDQGIVLNATIDVVPKEYQIDILTSNGNIFSKTASCSNFVIPFMGTSSVTVTNVFFDTGSPNTITVTLKNTGTQVVTIAVVKVNNQIATDSHPNLQINPEDSTTFTLSGAPAEWVNGNTYKIDLYDDLNQVVGSVQQNAPGA